MFSLANFVVRNVSETTCIKLSLSLIQSDRLLQVIYPRVAKTFLSRRNVLFHGHASPRHDILTILSLLCQPSNSTAVTKRHIFVLMFSKFYFQLNSQNTKPSVPGFLVTVISNTVFVIFIFYALFSRNNGDEYIIERSYLFVSSFHPQHHLSNSD